MINCTDNTIDIFFHGQRYKMERRQCFNAPRQNFMLASKVVENYSNKPLSIR